MSRQFEKVFFIRGSIWFSATASKDDRQTDPVKNSGDITVTIDGRVIDVVPGDKNIIDIATREKIALQAACYRADRKKGCCHGCVVEINGELLPN